MKLFYPDYQELSLEELRSKYYAGEVALAKKFKALTLQVENEERTAVVHTDGLDANSSSASRCLPQPRALRDIEDAGKGKGKGKNKGQLHSPPDPCLRRAAWAVVGSPAFGYPILVAA